MRDDNMRRTSWRRTSQPGMAVLEQAMTGAGRKLTSWLQALGPRRHALGLPAAEPAPYRPHNRRRAAARRTHRRMVAASRRANR